MDKEPVLIMAAVQAGIALALSFGLHLSNEQTGAIMAFTAAILAVILRSKVTPTGGK